MTSAFHKVVWRQYKSEMATCVKFFPDVTCQKLLKSSNVLRSYSKNKSGTFFMDHNVFWCVLLCVSVHSYKSIVAYIDAQYEKYLQDETGLNRRNIVDGRVHCCFYFINPSGHGSVVVVVVTCSSSSDDSHSHSTSSSSR